MAIQGLFTGGVKIRSLNGYLIAVNGEVFATTNTGGTTNAFFYQAKTTITSGDPGSGHLIWNNATQISATQLNVSHLTDTPVEDIDLFLSAIASGNKLVVQDRNDSANYQSWTVTGTPTQIGSTYWTIPVSLIESQGTGTTGFANNHDLLFAIITGGTGGGGITTNAVTFNNSGSGAASGTSFNGATAVTVSYNTFGAQQASASLTSLAGLTYASGTPFVKMTGAGTFALDTNTYITGNQTITLSGDVTGSGATAITTTIANNAVTLAKMAQVATARFLGRVTAGTGNVEALTGTQATTLLDTFTSTLKGLVPAPGTVGSTRFLREDGTWVVPGGGGGTPAGSNTQIQYNTSGAFGASANLTYDGSSLSVIGNGVLAKFDGTGTNDSYIDIQRGGTTQWRLGNNYNGGTKAFQIRDQVNNRNDFTINNSGQIGIGLNSVTSFLGSNSTSEVHDITGLKGFTRFVNYRAAGGNTSGNSFENYLTRTLTPGSFGATISGDQLMSYFAYGSSASNWIYGGSFKYDQNGATSSFVPGIWTFGASSGSTQDITTFRVDGGNDRIQFNTTSTERMRITSSGRVLMGSTLPTDNGVDALQVSGSAIATRLKVNTSGQTINISTYYNGGSGRNLWINDVEPPLTSTGSANVAIGFEALVSNTSGYRNTAIGHGALNLNTSGYANFALGASSLAYNTTGYENIAIGLDSLVNNTTGYNNVALGRDSGRYTLIGGNNQTSNSSIYIGVDTRSSANGNTNEIVIGHNAIGQGSNSVTLGNSSITQTLLRGTVTAGSYVKSGGTNSQVLYADGSTKQITSGTASPTGGNDGDIYLQYDVSLLTGSGTANYIPKFTSATAIGNSQIFDNGTNVGVGTITPTAKFDVNGVIKNNDRILANTNNANGTAAINTFFNNSTIAQFCNFTNVASTTQYGFMQGSDGTNYIGGSKNVFEYGNVGIGTTSPGVKLDVRDAGNTYPFFVIGNNQTNGIALGTDGSNNAVIQGINANFLTTNKLTLQPTGGNALIGTTTDNGTDRLQVSGTIRIDNNTGGIILNRVAVTNFTGTSLRTAGVGQWFVGMRENLSSNNYVIYNESGVDAVTITKANNNVLINTTTDNGTDRLQVSGSALVTGAFQAATTSGNVSLRTTASTYAVNMTLGANAGIGFYQDGIQSVIIGQNQNLSTTNELSARGANLDLVGIGATYVRIITNSNERARIASSGRVLINTTSDNGTDQLQVNGSIQANGFDQAYTAQTTTYTATTSDYIIDCTTGTFTVNLFTAVGNTGRILIIKNSGTGTITVDPNGSQTIDGATTQTLSTQWSRVHIISDGANWKIISN